MALNLGADNAGSSRVRADGDTASVGAEAPASSGDGNVVRRGDWVVIESSDGKRVLGHVVPKATARLAKRKRCIDVLAGCRWGDLFTVGANGKLIPADDDNAHDKYAARPAAPGDNDNRNLRDDEGNQKLSQPAIEQLKASGASGTDVVRAVVDNSSTFLEKTAFSQDKYLKRKMQKYNFRLRVVRPTALSVCETYFSRSPEKILGMRPDSLALLLGYSGVRAGVRAIVFENCTGLVTAAVAERMGGYGELLNVFVGATPSGTEVLKMTNAPEQIWSTIIHTPVEIFGKLDETEPSDDDWLRYGVDDSRPQPEQEFETSERRQSTLSMRPRRGDLKRKIRDQADVLLVATRSDVIPVIDVLLKHVAPSGTFAVFSSYLHPLSELQFALQLSKLAIRVELMEANLVNHQILPGRSHPMMSDSATGGYVLWGMRIEVAPP